MYLVSEAIRFLMKDKEADLTKEDVATLNAYKGSLDSATKFIPFWVKLAVAIALGLGTMIGWKRIVVTVGEKIGKTHLTYGQGAAAELVAAGTIFAADHYGLPVSTTHVLSSGVAGTMAANGSGLQMSTLRNIALAWVLTLPAAMMLSGFLYLGVQPDLLKPQLRRVTPGGRVFPGRFLYARGARVGGRFDDYQAPSRDQISRVLSALVFDARTSKNVTRV